MAALVHEPEHRCLEVPRFVPCGYSHVVAAYSDRERMSRHILAEPLLRHAQQPKNPLVNLLEGIDVVVDFFQGVFLLKESLGEGLGEDLLELRDKRGKDLVKIS